jgi:uncharacterized protein (TIGR03083 family)
VKTPSEVYAELRADTIALVLGLDPELTERKVPQCPEWSVKDVVAHVVGIVEDMLTNNLGGIGTDAWTASQVDRRTDMSLAEVCDEWTRRGPELDAVTTDSPFTGVRITADLVTHVHDIAAAVGVSVDRDTDAVRVGLERYGPFFCERVANAGLPVVRVEAGEQVWQSAEDEPVAVVRASAFELLRAFSGRRSLAQVRAMDWDGDAEPFLEVVTPYGLPESDVIE